MPPAAGGVDQAHRLPPLGAFLGCVQLCGGPCFECLSGKNHWNLHRNSARNAQYMPMLGAFPERSSLVPMGFRGLIPNACRLQ